MRVYTRYLEPGQKRRRRRRLGQVVLLIFIAFAGAVWWLWFYRTACESAQKSPPAEFRHKAASGLPATTSKPDPLRGIQTGTTVPVLNHPASASNTAASDYLSHMIEAFPRPVQSVFEAQVALMRLGISPGLLDGIMGPQTRAAIRVFQSTRGLGVTGELDRKTKSSLLISAPPCTNYIVTWGDLARLQPLSTTWLGKSQQTALEYETILELLAEKGCAHPHLIRRLNPYIDWTNVTAGTTIQLPDANYPNPRTDAAFIIIFLADKILEAFDAQTNLLVHFPCSIGRQIEKRPVGELHVASIAANPNYTFDPDLFPESPEANQLRTKLVLPPGPNNPVGVAWIGLDKPGYGIHGTPVPEHIGRTESHGCFRLANWDANYLLKLVWIGMPVFVQP